MTDPAYYETMSALLDEVIAARRAKAIEYEEYLSRIAEVARRVEAGHADETPEGLDTPGKRALWRSLAQDEMISAAEDPLSLAIEIDAAVRQARPDAWRGVPARERMIKQALYAVLQDVDAVNRIFAIVEAQKEY